MIGIFPLAAAIVAGVFCAALVRRFVARRQTYQLLWAIAMGMYALASVALFAGVSFGWSVELFAAYWLFGAILTVPALAAGEFVLLFPGRRAVTVTALTLLALGAAYVVYLEAFGAFSDPFTRAEGHVFVPFTLDLPRGVDVFGPPAVAITLARVSSYTAYAILLAGTGWSAWKMRRAPDLRGRFWGTLLIALGATIVAGGSAFAATGILVGFSLTLLAGISVMFLGFLKASASGPAPAPTPAAEPTA
ncbi:MAG: hypothetical protein WD004_02550 [Actinomycetota bacterium]